VKNLGWIHDLIVDSGTLPTMSLNNKHIVVAICGGIAAYKSAEFIRVLQRQGAHVRVAMTESATQFVTPLTFQALSGYPVHLQDTGSMDPAGMDHIALARWSDIIVVVPATANIIAKLAHGIADNFVSTLCLAHDGKLAIAPAMNQAMWNDTSTQNNVAELQQRGIFIFGPNSGLQACGETGEGRMLEPQQLVEQCSELFSSGILQGKHVLITAGPTVEPIDPVRFISNRSSGKMGYALADAALEAGACVTVISGPTQLARNDRVNYIDVETAQEMYQAALQQASSADLFIAAAAVADYTPSEYQNKKIKKSADSFSLSLTRTPDILKEIKHSYTNLFCVGFAAETDNLLEYAINKLKTKSIDMIIANQVGLVDQGFDSDFNSVVMIAQHQTKSLDRARKSVLARQIIEEIASNINQQEKLSNVRYL